MFDSSKESSGFGHTHDADAPTFVDTPGGSASEATPQDSLPPTEAEPIPADSLSRRALIYGLTGLAAGAIVGEPLWTTIQKNRGIREQEAGEEAEAIRRRQEYIDRVREQQKKQEKLINNFHAFYLYFTEKAGMQLGKDSFRHTAIPLKDDMFFGMDEGMSGGFVVSATMDGLAPLLKRNQSEVLSFWKQHTSIETNASIDTPDSVWEYQVTTRLQCMGYSDILSEKSDVDFRQQHGYGSDYVQFQSYGEWRNHPSDHTVTPDQLLSLHMDSGDNTVRWRGLQLMRSMGDEAFYRTENFISADVSVAYEKPASSTGRPEYVVYDVTAGGRKMKIAKGGQAYYDAGTKLISGSNELLNLMQKRVGDATFEIAE